MDSSPRLAAAPYRDSTHHHSEDRRHAGSERLRTRRRSTLIGAQHAPLHRPAGRDSPAGGGYAALDITHSCVRAMVQAHGRKLTCVPTARYLFAVHGGDADKRVSTSCLDHCSQQPAPQLTSWYRLLIVCCGCLPASRLSLPQLTLDPVRHECVWHHDRRHRKRNGEA